jgi:hypothetical protein
VPLHVFQKLEGGTLERQKVDTTNVLWNSFGDVHASVCVTFKAKVIPIRRNIMIVLLNFLVDCLMR